MTRTDEMFLIMTLIEKYNLPLSTELRSAITETIKTDSIIHDNENLVKLEQNLCLRAQRLLNQPVDNFPFSVRTINSLKAANLNCIKEVAALTSQEVRCLDGIGIKSFIELENFLMKFKLTFGMSHYDMITRLSSLSNKDIPCNCLVNHKATHHRARVYKKTEEKQPKEKSL